MDCYSDPKVIGMTAFLQWGGVGGQTRGQDGSVFVDCMFGLVPGSCTQVVSVPRFLCFLGTSVGVSHVFLVYTGLSFLS